MSLPRNFSVGYFVRHSRTRVQGVEGCFQQNYLFLERTIYKDLFIVYINSSCRSHKCLSLAFTSLCSYWAPHCSPNMPVMVLSLIFAPAILSSQNALLPDIWMDNSLTSSCKSLWNVTLLERTTPFNSTTHTLHSSSSFSTFLCSYGSKHLLEYMPHLIIIFSANFLSPSPLEHQPHQNREPYCFVHYCVLSAYNSGRYTVGVGAQ